MLAPAATIRKGQCPTPALHVAHVQQQLTQALCPYIGSSLLQAVLLSQHNQSKPCRHPADTQELTNMERTIESSTYVRNFCRTAARVYMQSFITVSVHDSVIS